MSEKENKLLCSAYKRDEGVIDFYKDGTFKVFNRRDYNSKKEKKFDSLGEKSKFILNVISP